MRAVLIPLLALAAAGCHGIHHRVDEPIATRVVMVETDDRWNFVLDEPAGCEWHVETSCEQIQWKVLPEAHEKDKTTVRLYILRGFARDEVVTLLCRRRRSGETVREIRLFLKRTGHDRASW